MLQTVLNEKLTFPHLGQVQSFSRVTSTQKSNRKQHIHDSDIQYENLTPQTKKKQKRGNRKALLEQGFLTFSLRLIIWEKSWPWALQKR